LIQVEWVTLIQYDGYNPWGKRTIYFSFVFQTMARTWRTHNLLSLLLLSWLEATFRAGAQTNIESRHRMSPSLHHCNSNQSRQNHDGWLAHYIAFVRTDLVCTAERGCLLVTSIRLFEVRVAIYPLISSNSKLKTKTAPPGIDPPAPRSPYPNSEGM
jgi:hypothetical protein